MKVNINFVCTSEILIGIIVITLITNDATTIYCKTSRKVLFLTIALFFLLKVFFFNKYVGMLYIIIYLDVNKHTNEGIF